MKKRMCLLFYINKKYESQQYYPAQQVKRRGAVNSQRINPTRSLAMQGAMRYTSLTAIIAAFLAPPSRKMVGMAPLITDIDGAAQITPLLSTASCQTTLTPSCHLIVKNGWSSTLLGYPGSHGGLKSHSVPSRHRHDRSSSRSAPRKAYISVGPTSCPIASCSAWLCTLGMCIHSDSQYALLSTYVRGLALRGGS